MATAAAARGTKDSIFEWEGKDKNGKLVRGEMRAGGEAVVSASLRRQGILITKVKKRRTSGGRAIKQKDIAIFTRQLATMMKAGVPLLQAFDIVARGSTNPRLTQLLNDIRGDVETGTSLSSAFRKHPLHFDALYCNLVEAGEAGGILEALLDRLAIYQEKTMAIKSKIKSALMYPIAVHRRRLRRADGDHDLRDPGVQGRVQLLRRRPAGADAVRDRDVGVLRHLLVGDLRLPLRRHLLLPRVVEALREDADVHGPAAAEACRCSAT